MSHVHLENHAPGEAGTPRVLPGAERLILIDNYDSFTWNLYQYLCREGATVQVYRNDQISLEELIALDPTQLVISPGPGAPDIEGDSGISRYAIRHFSGKVPVFGVCMGQQCMYSVFGGKVLATGEWHHGKTSPLRHDGKGLYEGLEQDIPVTRYHSLAGTRASLPAELEISSRIKSAAEGGEDIIMGIRHKTFTVEGVQFHPESITTAKGLLMCRNFLKMRGGTWKECIKQSNDRQREQDVNSYHRNGLPNGSKPIISDNSEEYSPVMDVISNGSTSSSSRTVRNSDEHHTPKPESILDKIFRHRKVAVSAQKSKPFSTPQIYQKYLDLGLAPPQIPFAQRLRQSPYNLSLMAEIKRASPSKGVIAGDACAPAQARKYALAGASVISVLTEPEWFKGDIEDLRAVRRVFEGMRNRPAILRKEFIFDEYQILEARIAGADTVLLIVKMLDPKRLTELYRYSQSLDMEPLVEVNTPEEMETALSLGAKVIGVNNRDLSTFDVDLGTTTRLMKDIPSDTVICALSGINGPADVEAYCKSGVGAILVGEALMRAPDTKLFVETLFGDPRPKKISRRGLLVKICGTRDHEMALEAIQAGADMIGMILAEDRKRTVTEVQALNISEIVYSEEKPKRPQVDNDIAENESTEWFDAQRILLHDPRRALLVGVFQNQSLEYIIKQQRLLNLDVVQLHGDEPTEWASQIPVPVLRRFAPNDQNMRIRGYHALPLLDSSRGGTGEKTDLENFARGDKEDDNQLFILAGGLDPDNVADTVKSFKDRGLIAVDVSSGVETNGNQDTEKIKQFIAQAKGAW